MWIMEWRDYDSMHVCEQERHKEGNWDRMEAMIYCVISWMSTWGWSWIWIWIWKRNWNWSGGLNRSRIRSLNLSFSLDFSWSFSLSLSFSFSLTFGFNLSLGRGLGLDWRDTYVFREHEWWKKKRKDCIEREEERIFWRCDLKEECCIDELESRSPIRSIS
jgi:hypothetical protein